MHADAAEQPVSRGACDVPEGRRILVGLKPRTARAVSSVASALAREGSAVGQEGQEGREGQEGATTGGSTSQLHATKALLIACDFLIVDTKHKVVSLQMIDKV